jgi:hypothetical protein
MRWGLALSTIALGIALGVFVAVVLSPAIDLILEVWK